MAEIVDRNQRPAPDVFAEGFWQTKAGDQRELRLALKRDVAAHWAQCFLTAQVPGVVVAEVVRELRDLSHAGGDLLRVEAYSDAEKAVLMRTLLDQCAGFPDLEAFIQQGMARVKDDDDLGGFWAHAEQVLKQLDLLVTLRDLPSD